jgi:hypothetical protein
MSITNWASSAVGTEERTQVSVEDISFPKLPKTFEHLQTKWVGHKICSIMLVQQLDISDRFLFAVLQEQFTLKLGSNAGTKTNKQRANKTH